MLANYLVAIKDKGTVTVSEEQALFSAVKSQHSRKKKNDHKRDTHTKSALNLYGLIHTNEDDSFSVSPLGDDVIACFEEESKFSQEDFIALMLKVFVRMEITDEQYDRHIHIGFILIKLLSDPLMDYYITTHELAHLVMNSAFINDSQYEQIRDYVLEFRNSGQGISQFTSQTKAPTFLATFVNNWKFLVAENVELNQKQKRLADKYFENYLNGETEDEDLPDESEDVAEEATEERPEVVPDEVPESGTKLTDSQKNAYRAFHSITKYRLNSLAAYIARLYLSLLEGVEVRDYLSYFSSSKKINDEIKTNQIIYFGAPGTGKSFKVESEGSESDRIRTTFHPDSDYSSFVGCYKPMQNPKDEDKIIYKFEGQCFTIAYINAWKRLVARKENEDINFTLVIEEINRGNCAQIFGDIFQLLDRDREGFSQYGIRPDEDLAAHLKEEFKEVSSAIEKYANGKYKNIANGKEMKLPPNLSIIATMNTSDQSLFPIDSAFKRRWDWEYIPIQYSPKKDEKQIKFSIDIDGTIYDWSSFIREINKRVLDITKSEDKQLGYFFVRPDNGDSISMKRFVSKVIFYLWSDIYKDYPKTTKSVFYFDEEYHTFNSFFEGDNIQADFVRAFIENLGINDIKNENQMSQIVDNNGVPFNKKRYEKIKDIIEEMKTMDMATLAVDPRFAGYTPGGGVPFIGTQVIENRSKLPDDDPKHISESSYKKYRSEQYELKDGYFIAVYNLSAKTMDEIRKKLGIIVTP